MMEKIMSKNESEGFSMRDPHNQTRADRDFAAGMARYFEQSIGTNLDKLRNFAKYVPRQDLSRFLVKHEIFKRILNIHGHIIECGVFLGDGVMTWAQFSAIHEPYAHVRQSRGVRYVRGLSCLFQGGRALKARPREAWRSRDACQSRH